MKHLAPMSVAALALASTAGVALAQDYDVDTTKTGSIGDDAVTAEIIALPEWHTDLAFLEATSVDDLIGMDVENLDGEDIGQLENVLFDENGDVLSVVAEVGGLWELGDTHVSIPWDSVEVTPDGVMVPVTEETVDDYSLFEEEVISAFEAEQQIAEVSGDGAGQVLTAPRAFRATEYVGDYVRLVGENEEMVNYGYVEDVLIDEGRIQAVVVRPDVGYGAPGLYAYPYYGARWGWTPASPYYDLPYTEAEIERIEPLPETS